MRRLSFLPVAGLLLTGFGCHHVGGKCDPAHPSDATPPALTNPYPYAPAPTLAGMAQTPAAKDAPAKLPGN